MVQPLLITGLLFALPLSVALEKRRPSLAEWLWAALLVAGLSVFLLAARPAAGDQDPEPAAVVRASGVVLVAVVVLIAVGYGWAQRHRATLLGFATGGLYGLTAALIKLTLSQADGGVLNLLLSWAPYALVAVGAGAIALNQAAYQAGPLAGALPPVVLTDSTVALTIAAIAFGESLQRTPLALALEAAGIGLIALAVVQLARLASGRGPQSGGQSAGATGPRDLAPPTH